MHHEPLPSQQHEHPGLARLDEASLHRRRETVFLVLAGLFLGTLAMLNILGLTRFIPLASWHSGSGWVWGRWGPEGSVVFAVAVGILPYPITFLCTDFISELYGRRRANRVVWVGLVLNLWVLAVLWVGGRLGESADWVAYGTDALGREVTGPPLPSAVYGDDGTFGRFNDEWTFGRIRQLTSGAVVASMIAYLAAQLIDVQVFHFWKRLTRGRHLWLRNNGSTLVSQFVDTFAVITITHFWARGLPVEVQKALWPQLWAFIGTGYAFKAAAALADTVPFYVGAGVLARYLRLPPSHTDAR